MSHETRDLRLDIHQSRRDGAAQQIIAIVVAKSFTPRHGPPMTEDAERQVAARNPRRTAVYFAAHEDDWQLFMNPAAFHDVRDEATRCVFVHMTAGDAGLGTGTGGRRQPYYLARENGAETAIRFMADSDNRRPAPPDIAMVILNGHPIRRVGYRNTTAYFLRLPDGNPEGTGYVGTGFQSLRRLADGTIPTVEAIDGSTVYRGFDDLAATLRALILHEDGSGAAIALHLPDPDAHRNPGDHADHMATAQAVLDAARNLPHAQRHYYVEYAAEQRPENLNAADRDLKCAVFAVTAAGLIAYDHPAAWQHYNDAFAGRTYVRVEGAMQRT